MTFLVIALLLIQVQKSLHFGPKILDQFPRAHEFIRASFIFRAPMQMVVHSGLLDEFAARMFDCMSIVEPHEPPATAVVQRQRIGQAMGASLGDVRPPDSEFHHVSSLVYDQHLSVKIEQCIKRTIATWHPLDYISY